MALALTLLVPAGLAHPHRFRPGRLPRRSGLQVGATVAIGVTIGNLADGIGVGAGMGVMLGTVLQRAGGRGG